MIYEFRTYDLKPRAVPEVEKRFAEALKVRETLSKLGAFWHTEVGPLNQIIHVWPYESFEERTRIRAEVAKLDGWPPNISEFIVNMRSEVFIPFPGAPSIRPGSFGPVYEMRYYQVVNGGIPWVLKSWEAGLEARLKLSELAFVGYSEIGNINRHMHIWAYKDFNHRFDTRAKAVAEGVWPPKPAPGAPDTLISQENKLLMPSAFSPMQ